MLLFLAEIKVVFKSRETLHLVGYEITELTNIMIYKATELKSWITFYSCEVSFPAAMKL